MKNVVIVAAVAASLVFVACSDEAGPGATSPVAAPGTSQSPSAGTPQDGAVDPSLFDGVPALHVMVPESGRVYVKLAPPSVVVPAGDPATSLDWDLAFEGFDVFTNSGASGAGQAASFGPLDAVTFLDAVAPKVPFLVQDKAGGAFLDWYAYDESSHALWSRYHVYGVRDGARLWKVQLLGYYGQRDGAAVPAIYKIRYAELTAGGSGPTIELPDVDGTAGGISAGPGAPSECLDLGTGGRAMLSADEARASSAWHLCFRRDAVTVNGGIGGSRGVVAVDLAAAAHASETLDSVMERTADGEKPAFDAAALASFEGKTFHGDRIVTAFSDQWIDATKSPIAPAFATWIVREAAGTQKYLLGFAAFEAPTATSPGVVDVRVKPVK
jgi:hypothetical protein